MPINFPDSPTNGQQFTSGVVTWIWNGSVWNPVGSGGANIAIADSAPASPVSGNLWWNSSPADGQLYIYFDDGSSKQWVQGNNLSGGGLYLPLTGGTVTGPLTLTPGPLVLNANVSALPTTGTPAGMLLHLGAADGNQTTIFMDTWGQGNQIYFRQADGTAAAPTATKLFDWLGAINGIGRGATAYGPSTAATILLQANENWTDTAQGARIVVLANPNGSTSSAIIATLQPGGCSFTGTNTNDSAAAGQIGEYLVATAGSTVTLVNGTTTAVASLSLSPGDWDVSGWGQMGNAGFNLVNIVFAINTSVAIAGNNYVQYFTTAGGLQNWAVFVGPVRMSVAVTTTVYLIGLANAGNSSNSTASSVSYISARRRR